MIRRLFALLVVLMLMLTLLPTVADGGGKRLVIHDQTSTLYDGIVQDEVDHFNAIMPDRGPTLVVQDEGYVVCAADVFICSAPRDVVVWDGSAWRSHGDGYIQAVDDLDQSDGYRHRIICHELMHILTEVADLIPLDTTLDSCVHGVQIYPGTYDQQLLIERYGNQFTDAYRRHKHHHRR